MQDEINEKVVALSVKGAKLTAEMLQKAIKAMLAQAKKQQEKQPHGKQTLAGFSRLIDERPTPTPENRYSSLSATTRKIHNDTPL